MNPILCGVGHDQDKSSKEQSMKTEDALAAGATVGAGACATISVSGITSGLAGIGGIAVGGIALTGAFPFLAGGLVGGALTYLLCNKGSDSSSAR
ncbi:hypothetical protein [Coleofasciculus sp. E2-BRE-01]|jgi:hypothetical protein|uniref:hypothetical protein n=1 Tax=unclassified Coleofasciculus TaxID=2692782 RepID=UPI0032F51BE8